MNVWMTNGRKAHCPLVYACISSTSSVLVALERFPNEYQKELCVRAHMEYGIMGYYYQDIAREMVCDDIGVGCITLYMYSHL